MKTDDRGDGGKGTDTENNEESNLLLLRTLDALERLQG